MGDDAPPDPSPATAARLRPGVDYLQVARLSLRLLAVALPAMFLYDLLYVRLYLVPAWEWNATRTDWLFAASAWLLALVGTEWYAKNRGLAARYWRRLRARPSALAALAFLGAFVLVGVGGTLVVPHPSPDFGLAYQPPAFASVDANLVSNCVGPVRGGRCHGTMRYPLGTDGFGYDVLALLVAGTHVALYVAVITAALVVPVGTLVGAVAGFFGDPADAVLMRYVDVQQTLPAVVVYVVLILVIEKSLFALVVIFGLFSWGGIARIVRGEVLQRRDAEYVVAATSAGGTSWYALRRHVLPNVSHVTVTALAQQVPVLLVTEAAVAYLGLASTDQFSWGRTIASGVGDPSASLFDQWWVSVLGVLALAGTVTAFKLVGDALRDVLDPRTD